MNNCKPPSVPLCIWELTVQQSGQSKSESYNTVNSTKSVFRYKDKLKGA